MANQPKEQDAKRLHAWVGGWGEAPSGRTLERWLSVGIFEDGDRGLRISPLGTAMMKKYPEHGSVGGY